MKYVRIVNGHIDVETIVEAKNWENARQELLDSDIVGSSDTFDVIPTSEIIDAAEILERKLCD